MRSRLLQRSTKTCRKFYQEQFQHVLVDEYQDTNKIQSDFIDIARRFSPPSHGRGRRRPEHLFMARRELSKTCSPFPQRFPGTREVRIETNYRSTPEILTLANSCDFAANTRSSFPRTCIRCAARRKILQAGARSACRMANQQAAIHLPAHRGTHRGGP